MLKRIDSRGSKVCEEWKNSYKNFLDWLYNIELPKHNVSIYEYETYKKLCDYDLDKDFYGGEEKLYCPENCRLIHHDFNMSLRNLSNCDIILSKDGKDIRITNVIDFLEGNGYKIRVRARIEGRNTICEDRGKEQGTGEELQKSAARKERGNNSNSNILTARQAKSR